MNSPFKQRLLLIRWWIFHLNRRQLRRWLYKVTRPASYPYITGDGFRRLAQHIHDETGRRVAPGRVKDGDIVFVRTEYARKFLEEVAPKIGSSYTLITHNSDVPVDESLVALFPERALKWFAINNTFRHPDVVPIPIGLENLHYVNVGVPNEYTEQREYSGLRKNRILAGFTIATNPAERQKVHDIASMSPLVERLPARLEQLDYLRTLVNHKFLLSPPGNGLDTHRTWEAMYLGVVPIVKDSVPMRAFEKLGLPVWILRGWDELLRISERELEDKYEELKTGFQCPALFMDYWLEAILGHDGAGEWKGSWNARAASNARQDGRAL